MNFPIRFYRAEDPGVSSRPKLRFPEQSHNVLTWSSTTPVQLGFALSAGIPYKMRFGEKVPSSACFYFYTYNTNLEASCYVSVPLSSFQKAKRKLLSLDSLPLLMAWPSSGGEHIECSYRFGIRSKGTHQHFLPLWSALVLLRFTFVWFTSLFRERLHISESMLPNCGAAFLSYLLDTQTRFLYHVLQQNHLPAS